MFGMGKPGKRVSQNSRQLMINRALLSLKFAKSAILLCMVPGMYCQESPATFEVASIKPNPDLGGLTRTLPNGGIHFIGVPLKTLVEFAYGVRAFQVIGGPGWIDTDAFD